MNKQIIIGVLAAVLVLGGLFYFARPNGNQPASGADSNVDPNAPAGSLTLSEKSFDFGSISMAKGKVAHTYNLKNASDQPVVIQKMYTSCMCTEANLIQNGESMGPFGMPGHGLVPTINQKVAPGAEIRVEAIFAPAAHGPAGLGKINRAVIMETNGGPVEVVFSANVTP